MTVIDSILIGLALGVVTALGVWLWCWAIDRAGAWLARKWFGE